MGGVDNIGTFKDGGWANFIVVPEEQVFKLPDGITLEQGLPSSNYIR